MSPARMRALVALLALPAACLAPAAARAQATLVAYGPESVGACEAAEVSVAATVPGTAVPRIALPSFAPFELIRTSTSSRAGVDAAGKVFTFVEGRYVLTTDRVGTYVIAPFEIHTAGGVVRSRPVRISVVAARGSVPSVVTRARIDTSLDVNFRALAMPETVYVGQQATYEVAVFLGEQVRDRMRRNPTFFPPEMQSMLAYDLPTLRGEPPRRRVGARCFDALVYQRAVFPLVAGRFVIPPAQLSYSLALSSSIFSREESRDVRTDSVRLVALDPPLAERPADFSGAVGSFAVRARVDTVDARVGDPVRLTVRVEGTGNVKLLPRPAVAVPWAALVPGDERVEVDSTTSLVRGAKEFDWVLTPHVAGELDVPPVRYVYFDPQARRYAAAAAPPLRMRVAPGALAAVADSVPAETVLPLRPRYRGPGRPPLHRQPLFWLVLAAAPVPALARRARATRRRRPRAQPADAALRALAASGEADARRLRRAYIEAAAERVRLPAETFTRAGALARALRRAGVSRGTAEAAERLLRELDVGAFGIDRTVPQAAAARAVDLVHRIDEEALTRAELGQGGVLVALALCVATVAGALQAASPSPRAQFDAGRAAYEARRYGEAELAFARVANRAPAAADAWANLGTAAWAAGDTAMAVVGWQRALRLEPLADDARDRLALVSSADVRSIGFVPPLPVDALALIAGALWCAAWAADALRGRRAFVHRAAPAMLGTLSAVGALVALDVHERQGGRSLVAVARPGLLSEAPSPGADRGAAVGRGEMARVLAHDGPWIRVRLDGGREGWLDAASALPLDEPVPERAGPPAS